VVAHVTDAWIAYRYRKLKKARQAYYQTRKSA